MLLHAAGLIAHNLRGTYKSGDSEAGFSQITCFGITPKKVKFCTRNQEMRIFHKPLGEVSYTHSGLRSTYLCSSPVHVDVVPKYFTVISQLHTLFTLSPTALLPHTLMPLRTIVCVPAAPCRMPFPISIVWTWVSTNLKNKAFLELPPNRCHLSWTCSVFVFPFLIGFNSLQLGLQLFQFLTHSLTDLKVLESVCSVEVGSCHILFIFVFSVVLVTINEPITALVFMGSGRGGWRGNPNFILDLNVP